MSYHRYIQQSYSYIGQSGLAVRFTEENSELQSAMSHEYFGKRVSLGAQAAALSYLALATRKTSL